MSGPLWSARRWCRLVSHRQKCSRKSVAFAVLAWLLQAHVADSAAPGQTRFRGTLITGRKSIYAEDSAWRARASRSEHAYQSLWRNRIEPLATRCVQSCRHARITRGRKLDEELVICSESPTAPIVITFKVTSCSGYLDDRVPTYFELMQQAWVLQPATSKARRRLRSRQRPAGSRFRRVSRIAGDRRRILTCVSSRAARPSLRHSSRVGPAGMTPRTPTPAVQPAQGRR